MSFFGMPSCGGTEEMLGVSRCPGLSMMGNRGFSNATPENSHYVAHKITLLKVDLGVFQNLLSNSVISESLFYCLLDLT